MFQEGSSRIFPFTSHFFWCVYLSMLGTYSDEFGKLDFERSQHGSGMSNRSQAKRFVSALNNVAERTYNNLFDLQQLRQVAKELQIRVSLEIKHFFNKYKSSQNYLMYLFRLLWCLLYLCSELSAWPSVADTWLLGFHSCLEHLHAIPQWEHHMATSVFYPVTVYILYLRGGQGCQTKMLTVNLPFCLIVKSFKLQCKTWNWISGIIREKVETASFFVWNLMWAVLLFFLLPG